MANSKRPRRAKGPTGARKSAKKKRRKPTRNHTTPKAQVAPTERRAKKLPSFLDELISDEVIDGLPSDLATNLDDYLYFGKPWPFSQ